VINIRAAVERHRIIYGVIGALLISVLLTMISMALYISSGASRLDLSRPGYEKVRIEVQHGDEEQFSSTGPMNSAVAEEFQVKLDKHRATLDKLGRFDSTALDDDQLRIKPSE